MLLKLCDVYQQRCLNLVCNGTVCMCVYGHPKLIVPNNLPLAIHWGNCKDKYQESYKLCLIYLNHVLCSTITTTTTIVNNNNNKEPRQGDLHSPELFTCIIYPGLGYRLSFDRNILWNGVRGLHLMKFNPGHWMLSKQQRTLFKISYTQCLLIKIYVYFVGVAGLGR